MDADGARSLVMADDAADALVGDAGAALLGPARAAVPGCVAVRNARRLTGGANQETWAFDAVTQSDEVPLILRRARGGSLSRDSGIGLEAEAALILAVHAAGVPAPEVLHRLAPEDKLGKGFMMRRIAGETIPRRLLRDDAFAAVRPALAAMCGRAMAQIHSVPAHNLKTLLHFYTPRERVEWLHARLRATRQTSPVFSYALAWLRDHAPAPPQAAALVHGDFRNGNLMIGPEGLRAVLDWENAHLGDPAEDLGWFCVPSWRFGHLDRPAGGFGSREELLAGYEAQAGQRPSPDRLRFWEAYGSLYWGMVCARSVEEFRGGSDATVERAMIARRRSEAELDLLRLIAPRKAKAHV
jgi:aminoglycoside phosphotransferase (APT) family kinase protein